MNFILHLLFLGLIWLQVVSTNIVPTPNYRVPKNIAFSTQGGGSSHHMWVFEILKEMHRRGHTVSFLSRGDQLHFAQQYPMLKKHQVGGHADFLHHPNLIKLLSSHPTKEALSAGIMESCMVNYPNEYMEHQEFFASEKIDLVLCDFFSISCIDAAIMSKLPVIITTTVGIFADNTAGYINNKLYTGGPHPTTQLESLWTRMYRDFVRVPRFLRRISKKLTHTHAFQQSLGLEPTVDTSSKRYNDVTKLINNLFGIEIPRKHSPLVHMIGPIMQSSYPPLDNETADFLNRHKHTVYIAFGQNAVPTNKDVDMIVQSLLILLEHGSIDSIIWARFNIEQLPATIRTSQTEYTKKDIINHRNILFIKWAPQYAILAHPSTSFFISHGGAASMHEALYNQVRLFVYPFYGDQPANARAIERIGIGRRMNTMYLKYDVKDYDLFMRMLTEVATDPQNKIQHAVQRYSAYVQVSASNSVRRGADVMEESLFASDDQGKLYYRADAGYEIHWIKRRNLDIYAVLVASGYILCKIGSLLLRKTVVQKIKSL